MIVHMSDVDDPTIGHAFQSTGGRASWSPSKEAAEWLRRSLFSGKVELWRIHIEKKSGVLPVVELGSSSDLTAAKLGQLFGDRR